MIVFATKRFDHFDGRKGFAALIVDAVRARVMVTTTVVSIVAGIIARGARNISTI